MRIIPLFPKDLNDYTSVTSLGGGTASTYQLTNEKTGHSVVLKYGAHADAIKIEILTNFLYQALGVPVPRVQICRELPPLLASQLELPSHMGIFQVSEYIVPHHHDNHRALIAHNNSQFFMAHILLGNIDITKDGNFVINAQGEVYCIDAGANFIFRSLGEERKEEPSLIREIDIDENGGFFQEWFANLNQEEIKNQIRAIIEKQNEIEAVLWEVATQLELADELRIKYIQCFTDRLDRLTTRFCPDEYYAKVDKKAHSDETAAGVFTYAFIENQPHVLLSKRVRHQWWDNFGGKSDKEDTWLYQTAAREVFEESSGVLNYSERELLTHPSHDLITQKDNHSFTYRLYFIEHDYVDLQSMMQHGEHTDYRWMPLEGMVRGLQEQQVIFEENEQTIQIDFATGKTNEKLILYPPLYRMLQQTPVQDHLENLLSTGRLIISHTQGVNEVVSSHKRKCSRINAPELMRLQIAEMAINYSKVIRACKQKFSGRSEPSNDSITPMEIDYIPPSEWHLQAVLGREYQKNKLAANVRKMVETKLFDTKNLTFEQREQLITQCIHLIEIEKQHPDRVYFYHACDAKVAFAYEVYSIMQQILHQENHWFAFRASNTHVKQFANIQAFIDHYSEHGFKKVHNNAKDYHESVISTNVFLFGNHEQPASCSVNYLMNNKTSRKVDLRTLFMDLFQSFGISNHAIDTLIRLFDLYAKDRSGVLYQINLPKDRVSDMAYPAGYMGILNLYQEQKDLPAILDTLAHTMTSEQVSTDIINYIFKLQARLFVPPHYSFSVRETRSDETNSVNQKLTNNILTKCIEEILYVMFLHLDIFNAEFFQESSSLMRAFSSLYQENAISSATQITEAMLAKAILKNNEMLVRKILKRSPNLIHKPVTIMIDSYLDSLMNSYMTGTPLELIVYHSTLSAHLLEEYFGHRWFEQLPTSTFIDFSKLIKILEKMPATERLAFVQSYHSIICTIYDVINVLKLLAPPERLIFADIHQNKIVYDNEFVLILGKLEMSDRLDFAKKYQAKIRNGDVLGAVLEQLNIHDCLSFAVVNQDKIGDGSQLAVILKQLDIHDRLSFAVVNQDKIDDGSQLAVILKQLDIHDRLNFAVSNQDKVQDGQELIEVLKKLDSHDRLGFAIANQDKIYNGNELGWVLKELDIHDRLSFALANHYKISAGYELAWVLEALNHESASARLRLALVAINFKEEEKVHWQLKRILMQLDSSHHSAYTIIYRANVNNGFDIANVLQQLSDLESSIRLLYAENNRDKILSEKECEQLIRFLDEKDRPVFKQAWQNKHKENNSSLTAGMVDSLTLFSPKLLGRNNSDFKDLSQNIGDSKRLA